MSDRYIVTSRAGVEAVSSSSIEDAQRWHAVLGGEIIDRGDMMRS